MMNIFISLLVIVWDVRGLVCTLSNLTSPRRVCDRTTPLPGSVAVSGVMELYRVEWYAWAAGDTWAGLEYALLFAREQPSIFS